MSAGVHVSPTAEECRMNAIVQETLDAINN